MRDCCNQFFGSPSSSHVYATESVWHNNSRRGTSLILPLCLPEVLRINHDLVVVLILILILILLLVSCCSNGTSDGRCGSRLGAVFGLDALPNKGEDRLRGCLCKVLSVKEL
jgi:hypothetical protein